MNPRVIVDLRAIQSRHHGERGIGRYVLSLVRAVERSHRDLVTDYLLDPAFPIPPAASVALTSGKAIRSDQVPSSYRSAGGVFLMSSPFEEATSLDTILPTWARGSRWRSAAVLYDLIPLLFPDKYLDSAAAHVAYSGRTALLRQADHLFAISEASKNDAVSLLGVPAHRIDVIYAGADPAFERPPGGPKSVGARLTSSGQVPGLRVSYILFTGGPDYRKNITGLLEAFSLLPSHVRASNQLVVVCKLDSASRQQIQAAIGKLGIDDDVLLTGFVDDRTLVALTQAASLVVFPSFYEGFGLPVLEAQQCGTPAICSDNSSLVEVQPNSDARFDPGDAESIANAIARALTDDELRAELSAQSVNASHTWSAAGNVTAAGLRKMLESVPASRPRPTVSLVHCGDRDTLSNRAQAFIRAASARFDISLVELPAHDTPLLPEAQKVVADAVRSILLDTPTDFVWWLASGEEMPPPFSEAFRSYPGLLLVDSSDMRTLYGVGVDPFEPGASAALGTFYPGRYNTLGDGSVDAGKDASIRAGMLCTKELVDRSSGVFCLSAFLGRQVSLDTGSTVSWIEWPQVPADQHLRREVPEGTTVRLCIDTQGPNEPVEVAIDLAVERLVAKGYVVDRVDHIDDHGDPASCPNTVYLFLPRMHYGDIPDHALAVVAAGGAIVAEATGAFAEYGHPQVVLLDEGYQTADLAAAILVGLSTQASTGSFWSAKALAAGVRLLYNQLVVGTMGHCY